jgi:hypothetical protein
MSLEEVFLQLTGGEKAAEEPTVEEALVQGEIQ